MSTEHDDAPKSAKPSFTPSLSPATAVVIILVVIVIVVAVGWKLFLGPGRLITAKEIAAAKEIKGKTIAHQSKGDTAACSIQVIYASAGSYSSETNGPTVYPDRVIDCKATIHSFKGKPDLVVTTPPAEDNTYRERITLFEKGEINGQVDIPLFYEYGGLKWRVRDVYPCYSLNTY